MIKVDDIGGGYFEVRPINFITMMRLSTEVVVKDEKETSRVVQRMRTLKQVKSFDESGKERPFTAVEYAAMPPKIGKAIIKASSEVLDTEGEAEILLDGDGITAPVLVKLSSPLTLGDQSISELEFHAKTFGDIEGILAESNGGKQAIIFIEELAHPVVSNLKLQRLPQWAVDQLSVIDGMFIARKVLPRFLE